MINNFHCIFIITAAATQQRPGVNNLQFRRKAGGYTGLVKNTNYTIASDSTTGYPKITYTDATTRYHV